MKKADRLKKMAQLIIKNDGECERTQHIRCNSCPIFLSNNGKEVICWRFLIDHFKIIGAEMDTEKIARAKVVYLTKWIKGKNED